MFRRMSGKPVASNNFLNGPNYQNIVGFLRNQYTKKLGKVDVQFDTRIQKTVQHYMTQVNRVRGSTLPLQALNQDVLRESTTSLDLWIRKNTVPTQATSFTVGTPSRPDDYSRLYDDTNTRLENVLMERAPPANAQPPALLPDFKATQDTLKVEEEDPVLLMQRLQKQRDEQTRSLGISMPADNPAVSSAPRLEIKEEKTQSGSQPVPTQADLPPPLLAPRPQDYIIPQDDIVKYIETEHNIFITSSDRDWLKNNQENRYNFSVSFNAVPYKNGFNYNTSIIQRFRNIQRIEFVKAIVPLENLKQVVRYVRPTGSSSYNFDTSRVVNVFALPFAGVRIAELNNNSFSTNPEEDNTFAIVQYDATWSSDLTVPNNYNSDAIAPQTKSGYTCLIPKFLRTQKVYWPTPLGVLNRLSIRVENHFMKPLTEDPDVLMIERTQLGSKLGHICTTDFTGYSVAGTPAIPNAYIFIRTYKYFISSAVSEGDNIVIQGVCVQFDNSTLEKTNVDFQDFINRPEGHYVVATGYVDSGGNLNLGRNDAGYVNVIIIRSRFNDPTNSDPAINTLRTNAYFGGSSAEENNLAIRLNSQDDHVVCGLINMSRQTHFALRVITRELDSAANIRPDNV